VAALKENRKISLRLGHVRKLLEICIVCCVLLEYKRIIAEGILITMAISLKNLDVPHKAGSIQIED
jgi:hypothetical protein